MAKVFCFGFGFDECFPLSNLNSDDTLYESDKMCSDPMDCRLPGSSIHGIFQARVLEWGAIAFSDMLRSSILKKYSNF